MSNEPHGSLSLFLWEQATPSVRAGRRYPAERTAAGEYASAPLTATQFIEGVSLQHLNREGDWVDLCVTSLFRTANAGDVARLRLHIEGTHE